MQSKSGEQPNVYECVWMENTRKLEAIVELLDMNYGV